MWPDAARALAHALPIEHGRDSEPVITIALLVAGVFAALLAGLLLARRAMQADARAQHAAAALALGALLFLFFDLLKETASLGQGVVTRPLYQGGLLLAFAAGLVGLAWWGGAGGVAGPRLAWAWAIGIAAHGMGEGWIVGTEAYSTAFAEPTQAASFLLHKLIEGFSILLVANTRLSTRATLAMAAVVSALALVGALAGFALGAGTAPAVLFAGGAGATALAIMLLSRRVPPNVATAAWVAAGVVVIYAAGVLHQY